MCICCRFSQVSIVITRCRTYNKKPSMKVITVKVSSSLSRIPNTEQLSTQPMKDFSILDVKAILNIMQFIRVSDMALSDLLLTLLTGNIAFSLFFITSATSYERICFPYLCFHCTPNKPVLKVTKVTIPNTFKFQENLQNKSKNLIHSILPTFPVRYLVPTPRIVLNLCYTKNSGFADVN